MLKIIISLFSSFIIPRAWFTTNLNWTDVNANAEGGTKKKFTEIDSETDMHIRYQPHSIYAMNKISLFFVQRKYVYQVSG